ncbi:DUF2062 domain-containing protein [candidate division KSB1 bacterium]|nr:DUF2062 domain-containing protein [candidate division KSB1 bacterium]NIR69884.1 DUF2062 domain-containing protein [candidate division KSB1 bacterium]NIS28037.1 DUF2062 domain-containing protein [candidate division KSB1 bacterium]NIT74908.1 DUF2062 domain-containing protein [candidate division KSB1 bacterium]NIU28692.1 DUF2062 domain-containing protein [candidate division KSB1 bacterium]
MNLRSVWERKIIKPIVRLLKQGITPEKIALSIAFGVTLGIFPVLGSTTILCTIAAVTLSLNLPAIQLVNYLVYPLQILLLIPFYRAGAVLFNAKPLPLSASQVVAMIQADVWGAIQFLWDTTMRATVVWLIVAPLIIAALYYVLVPAIRKLLFKSTKNVYEF